MNDTFLFFNLHRFNLEKKYYGQQSHYSSSWCAARLVSVDEKTSETTDPVVLVLMKVDCDTVV